MNNRKEFAKIPDANLQSKFHRFNLAHQEMSHFVRNVFNYILVEVLESAWREFLDGMKGAEDLDCIILLQKKFISNVMDKALLSENQKKLYKQVLTLLNQIFLFTHIKDVYFYSQALKESKRVQHVQSMKAAGREHELAQEDLTFQVNQISIDELEGTYDGFQKHFNEFYNMIEAEVSNFSC